MFIFGHDVHVCHVADCGCGHFNSSFVCAACDKHWEDHETFFETEQDRAAKGLPVGRCLQVISTVTFCP